MAVDLFAGLSVADYAGALTWYERLLGSPPAFLPNDVEAVWEVGEHQYIYVEKRPEHAGHGLVTLFVDDLDERVARAAQRGVAAAKQETYENGVRKITYVDPDGNEIGFGGAAV
jgi:predicted enzyme related to lactoylglutathione lyase